MSAGTRPVTLLIAALGGEGGGVLTNWILNAAERAGLPAQGTSIPGVAQRTGATTYYVEIWPQTLAELDGKRPVLSLAPAPGEVDIVAATELLEAGRSLLAGFVTPDRTALIASTHRVYTTREKMAMGDGRFDPDVLHRAARKRAETLLLMDMDAAARQQGTVINSVMLGAIAGSGRLPIAPEVFEAGIAAEGKAVEANLRGFRAGLEAARNSNVVSLVGEETAAVPAGALQGEGAFSRAKREFPAAIQDVLGPALARLIDYQDAAYAELYLNRLAPLRGAESGLLRNVARHLAVRMTFEDIIRVADLKTRRGRISRIRAEAGAADGEPVAITEFLKPRFAEVCDMLPAGLAGRVLAFGEKHPSLKSRQWAMQVNTTTLSGFLRLWGLARLRRFRPRTYRYKTEQAAIDSWLADIAAAQGRSVRLAKEIAECARLIKGYGETHRRGTENFNRIREALVLPVFNEGADGGIAAAAVAEAREAALADPEGEALSEIIRRHKADDADPPKTRKEGRL